MPGSNQGILIKSDGGFGLCSEGSCNPEGTGCGECLVPFHAGRPTCTNVDGVGQVTNCVQGKKVISYCGWKAPCGVSDVCAICGEGVWKCEDGSVGSDGKSTGILKNCKDGNWSNVVYYCPKGMGCNAEHTFCDTETTICVNSSAVPDGFEATLEGDTITINTCSSSHSCTAEGKCGECKNSDHWCSGESFYTCEQGVVKTTPCTQTCTNGTSC